MKGYIHSIDSFSTVDGDGIRMAVFFQGCPLDCLYCHNPDSKTIFTNQVQLSKVNWLISSEEVSISKNIEDDLLTTAESNYLVSSVKENIRITKNIEDDLLTTAKNNNLVSIDKENIRITKNIETDLLTTAESNNLVSSDKESKLLVSIDEIVAKYEKNKRYYKNGGITIIGGEPLLQEDYLIALLRVLKEKNIHTIIDTSLAVSCKNLTLIASLTNKMIVDIKFYNENDYKKYCKASLKLVLSNLEKILGICEIELRTVIAPNINDKKTDILEYANLTKKYKCKHTLLAFHNMGQYKYEQLNIYYKMSGVANFDRKLLQEYQLLLDINRNELAK